MSSTRTELDGLGSLELPAEALHGIHTQRAVENFPMTGVTLAHFPELVSALALVKDAAAQTNVELGVLAPELGSVIREVCAEITGGAHHEHFVVDMVQGGAGTSTNMNANEVIANLGLLKLGHRPGEYAHLHPNDHVNRSQSTNDVYPTAIRLAILNACAPLLEAQADLSAAFAEKGREFDSIRKVGRTQLQDAVPMTLGAEFRSFASTIDEDIARVRQLSSLLTEVNLGGTAVGTRITAPDGYGPIAVRHLARLSGWPLVPATDLIEASSDLGAFVTFSSVLKRIAVKLSKICNDLRLLSSGPRAGIGEIILPPVQAGSSIMPGKINPVIPEVVNQVAYQVIGNDLTITFAAEAGQLQLNAMEPIVAFKLLESIRSLSQAMRVLQRKCVSGIRADEARCTELLNGSLVLATTLVPLVGYEMATRIAKTAHAEGRDIATVAAELAGLAQKDLANALSRAIPGE